MKSFADLVEQLKELTMEEKEDLYSILDRILADERRKEILQNHRDSITELDTGKLKFYTNPEDLLRTLNEDGKS